MRFGRSLTLPARTWEGERPREATFSRADGPDLDGSEALRDFRGRDPASLCGGTASEDGFDDLQCSVAGHDADVYDGNVQIEIFRFEDDVHRLIVLEVDVRARQS